MGCFLDLISWWLRHVDLLFQNTMQNALCTSGCIMLRPLDTTIAKTKSYSCGFNNMTKCIFIICTIMLFNTFLQLDVLISINRTICFVCDSIHPLTTVNAIFTSLIWYNRTRCQVLFLMSKEYSSSVAHFHLGSPSASFNFVAYSAIHNIPYGIMPSVHILG